MGCPGRQSPASHLPVVRQPIACSAPRQPHTSHSPATRQPLACLLTLIGCSCAFPPRHADAQRTSRHFPGIQVRLPLAQPHACRTPASRTPASRPPLACRTPALHMSGAPPAAHQPSASCLLAPCQLRSCRSPVALPALTGVLLQTRGGPLPAISACSCSGDARFDSGLVPLPGASCAPTCSRCSLLEQLVTCMLVRSHGIVVLVLVLPPAAHQLSASCLLAPCQLRSCSSPVALPLSSDARSSCVM